ncbi:hypothetical protein BKG94_07630, partial [Rodentibacter ratti]|uniref:ESPR-type extended signal peptide-containing protein n=1 Tax=Rodentibacter ratti TaxID=1906745 RepID=UPI0009856D0A
MNKIFKVIWNYATQSWVAVSELQKAKGKTKSLSLGSNVVRQSSPMLKFSLISSGLLLASGQVIAATGTDNTAAGQCYYDTTTNSVICGDNKTKNNTTFTNTTGASVSVIGNYSVAVGSEANAFNEGDIAIGRYAGQNRADKGSNFGGSGNVYSGGALISTPAETISTSHGVSIGRGAGMDSTGVKNTAIGYYAGRQHFGDNSITIGTFANNFLTNGLSDGKAVGNTIDALANNSRNVPNIVNRSRDSIAIGYGAMTYDDEDVAIGKNAKTIGNNAMAIGRGARAGMAYTVMNGQSLTGPTLAVGQGATAALGGDVSIGINAGSRVTQNATQLRNGVNLGESKNISLGNAVGNNVYGRGNLAFGVTAGGRVGTAEAININNVAFGNEVGNDVRGDNNIGIGWQTAQRVRSNSNLAFGARSGNDINGPDNIAVGFNAGNRVNGGGNWAAGYHAGKYVGVLSTAGALNVNDGTFQNSAVARSLDNTAIGKKAGTYVNGDNNVAIGRNSGRNVGHKTTSFGTKSADNIAIGATAGSFIEGNYNLAFGVNAGKGTDADNMLVRTRSVSQGYNATAYTNDSLAIGTNAKAGIQSTNGTGDINAIAIGNSSTATKENSIAYGTKATATAKQAIAIGDTSTASGNTSVAIGPESKSQGWASVALGDYAQSSKDFAIAVGGWSKALGQDSIAFGRDTNASANESIAIGHKSKVSGTKSTVIGIGNNVSGENTFVLGNNVTATTNGSVVLGDEATTEGSHDIANVTNATLSGIYYGDFVGTVKDSGRFVSVGAKGDERKLINVAAGNISATSTEAINGSQLYLVTNTLRDQMPVVYTTTDGTKVTKQGDKFYKVNPDGSLGDEVPASNVIASMNNGNNSTTTPTTLTNVAGNLQGAKANTTAPTTSGTAPTPEEVANISNNAATVGDVLNAGWNLQENGTAKDFVKPYDTVNFVNGTGTIANVTTTNGTISNVTFNVDTGSITPASNEDVKDKDDNVVIPSGEVSVADGQANKIATVQNVADAINSAG